MRKKLLNVMKMVGIFIAIMTILGMSESGASAKPKLIPIFSGLLLAMIIMKFTDSSYKKDLAIMERLRIFVSNSDDKIIGSFNARFYHGGSFKSFVGPKPAVLSFSEDNITLTTEDSELENHKLIFRKEEVHVLWIGDSGRPRDWATWLKIKDPRKECLISLLSHQPSLPSVSDCKKCGTEFFSKVTDLGFNTAEEANKRGLFAFIADNTGLKLRKSWLALDIVH